LRYRRILLISLGNAVIIRQMVILPMLIGFYGNAEQAVARNAAYLAKVQSMSVQIEATSSSRPGNGKAFLLFKRPASIAFDLKWGDEDYSLRANKAKIIEIERNSRMYSVHEPTGGLLLPPLDLSRGIGLSFPGMLLQKGVASAIPPGARLKFVGSEKTGGILADRIRANYKTQVAEVTVDAWIDKSGALRRYDIQVVQAMSRFANSLQLSNYRINPKTFPGQYEMTLPIGYVPFVFDEEPLVIGPGKKLKIGKLADMGGKSFDLEKWLIGQKTLVVVAGKGCQPSLDLLKQLRSLAGTLRSLAIVPDRSVSVSASKVVIDAHGAAIESTSTPSTPLIALVDSRGVVRQVWLGFDKKNMESLSLEIRTVSAQVK